MKKWTFLRKTVAFLFVFCMMINLFPASVAAAGTDFSDYTVLNRTMTTLTDGKYYLNTLLYLNNPITVTGDVTLDLNGFSVLSYTSGLFTVANGGTLTINDSDSTRDSGLSFNDEKIYGSVLMGTTSGPGGGAITVESGGVLRMYGGTVYNCTSTATGSMSFSAAGIYVAGAAVISNVKIINCLANGSDGIHAGGIFVDLYGNLLLGNGFVMKHCGGNLNANLTDATYASGIYVYSNDKFIVRDPSSHSRGVLSILGDAKILDCYDWNGSDWVQAPALINDGSVTLFNNGAKIDGVQNVKNFFGYTGNISTGYEATGVHTVKFNLCGGSGSIFNYVEQLCAGVSAKAPNDPTRTGYTFAGWYNSNGKYTFTDDEVISEDTVLAAAWLPDEDNKTVSASVSDASQLQAALASGMKNITLTDDIYLTTDLSLNGLYAFDLNGYVIYGNIKMSSSTKLYLSDSRPNATHSDSSLPCGGVIKGNIDVFEYTSDDQGRVWRNCYIIGLGGSIVGDFTIPFDSTGILAYGNDTHLSSQTEKLGITSLPKALTSFYGSVINNAVSINPTPIKGGIYYGDVNTSYFSSDVSYVYTFMVDNSVYAYEITADDFEWAAMPVAPTKNGYTFDGWYTENGKKFDFENLGLTRGAHAELTLTARFKTTVNSEEELKEALENGVTMLTLGSDVTLTEKLKLDGGKTDIDVVLDLNGYVLKGDIYMVDDATLTLTDSRPEAVHTNSNLPKGGIIDGAIELTRSNYGDACYLYANGGTVMKKVSLNSYIARIYCTGDTPTAFMGYVGKIGEIHGGIYYNSGISTGCIKEKTVTFKNDGNTYALEVVPAGNKAVAPLTPTKEGYTLAGWYNGDNEFIFANTAISEDITLTAKWKPITYSITYNSGTNGSGSIAEGNKEHDISFTLTNETFTRTGYTQIGWATVDGGEKIYELGETYTDNKAVVLYPVWLENSEYTIKFNSNGGTAVADKANVKWTDKVLSNITAPTKAGCNFSGWVYNSVNVTDATTYGELALNDTVSSIELTAQWQDKYYEISLDMGPTVGLAIVDNVKWNDKVLDKVPEPKLTGWQFVCWMCEETQVTSDMTYGDLVENDSVESITLKAKWRDITPPTGEIAIGESKWDSLNGEIGFELFFNTAQMVSITAQDNSYLEVSIEYLLSGSQLTESELQKASFTKYTGAFDVEPDNEYIIYAKLTDKEGNISYINSNGIVLDETAPIITGVKNGDTYYTTQRVTVADKYLAGVTLNGDPVEESFTLSGDTAATYVIVATDKAGNSATVTVTMKQLSEIIDPINGISKDNITDNDRELLEQNQRIIDDLLNNDELTDSEKEKLESAKENLDELVEQLDNAKAAVDTDNTDKVKDITSDNVKVEDKSDLEAAKKDLEAALEDFGGNYTDEEKQTVQKELDRINDTLDSIGNAEKVEGMIGSLPGTVKPSDDEAVAKINEARDAYNALTDNEKSMINASDKAKLEKLIEQSTDYKDIDNGNSHPANDSEGDTPKTGDSSGLGIWLVLLFISGGMAIVTVIRDKKKTLEK